MASTTRRWATGCGCGCGLLALVLGLLGWGGYVFIRGFVGEAEKGEAVMAEVRERHGSPSDFQPSPTGSLPPERVETFLRVRELMADTRRETQASLTLLSSHTPEGASQVPGVLGHLLAWGLGAAKIEGATNLLPQVVGFVSAKGNALLEAGMGPGEYLYIYSIAYYSWLARSPADGPAFTLVGDDEKGHQSARGGQDEFDVREQRRELILARLNEQLLPMLRRQLAALEESDAPSTRWREELAAEITAMENDRFRIPWRDGVPERMAASLEPYRRQLRSSYSAMCNPLEIIPGSGE
jgi:hypothetical protein